MIIMLIPVILAFNITEIPAFGAPQSRSARSSSVYDPLTSRIISFGGIDVKSKSYLSTLYAFNLLSGKWSIIRPQSSIKPPGLVFFKLYLRSDRKLLVFFGLTESIISSVVYSYNLLTDIWEAETLTGDTIQGLSMFGFTSFTYNNKNYVALYGGSSKDLINSDLYLIDADKLIVRRIKSQGETPGGRIGLSLVYYQEKIYLFGGNWPITAAAINNSDIYMFSLSTELWSIVKCGVKKPMTRTNHYSYVYKDSMYVFYGGFSVSRFDEIWKFDLISSEWSLISVNQNHFKSIAGSVQVDNKVYILFGANNETQYSNSIDLYELTQDSVKYSLLVGNWESPTPRKNHCSMTLANSIYIFGGISDLGEYLNDMWKFDLKENIWSLVTPSGDIPEPRASFACAYSHGGVMFIYGGKDSANIFEIFHYYDSLSNRWVKLPTAKVLLRPSFSTCICLSKSTIFIIGGQNNDAAFDDIWQYEYLTNSFSLVGYLPQAITGHHCWVEASTSENIIYVVGGRDFSSNPNNNLYKIEISKNKKYLEKTQTFLLSMNSSYIGTSDSAFVKSSDYVYLIYGSLYNTLKYNYITRINYKTLEIKMQEVSSELSQIGHSASHSGNSIYVFGGGLALEGFIIQTSAINTFLRLEGDISISEIACSAGTYGPECTPCQAGYYESSGQCIPCPAGRFSNVLAADDLNFCMPCAFGYFSDTPGATYCIMCPANTYCPMGSSKPLSKSDDFQIETKHPSTYKGNSSDVTEFYSQILISALIFAVCITFFIFASNKCWDRLQLLDFFSDMHPQEENVPIIYRKNNIGAIFFIYFLIAAVVIISGGIYSYVIDNIDETRSLVPTYTLDDTIKAEKARIEIVAYLYGGTCVVNGKCNSENILNDSEMLYETRNYTCEANELGCKAIIEYTGLEFNIGSEVFLQMLDRLGFASAITINITVSSSIPNENSSVFIPIFPDSKLKAFRGLESTVAYFGLTPSVFTSESSRWPNKNTGYHITNSDNVILGSTVTQKEINSVAFVLIKLKLQRENTGFLIHRSLKATWLLFVGSLFGTVFGIMGSFAATMSFLEPRIEKWSELLKEKRVFQLLELRKTMKRTLRVDKVRNQLTPYLESGIQETQRKIKYNM